jgi:long-subunit fatty acid transport protein
VADLTWANWSAFQNPAAHLDIALTLQIPPALGGLALPPLPSGTALANANFHDTFVPRLGVEWRIPVSIHTFALRAGYRYDPSPVPNQVASSNYMDATRHVFSLGAGIVIRGLQPVLAGSIGVDVFGGLQALEPRTVLKADPSDPVGDYVLNGMVFTTGASVSVVF